MPNEAPYKIQKRGDKFVVLNNTGAVKASFDDREKALTYQRALYVNVKGAAKKADRVKFTGKKKPPKDTADLAAKAKAKKHKFRPAPRSGGGGSWGPVVCQVCGQAASSPVHTDAGAPAGGGGTTATASFQDWAAKCQCGRVFATQDGYDAHFVSLHDAEPDPKENAENDAKILADAAAEVKPGDRKKGGMSDNSYPITNQAQAESAWKLRNNSKNHSEAEVVAHIRRRVKALGLKMPGGDDKACCGRTFFTDVAFTSHLNAHLDGLPIQVG